MADTEANQQTEQEEKEQKHEEEEEEKGCIEQNNKPRRSQIAVSEPIFHLVPHMVPKLAPTCADNCASTPTQEGYSDAHCQAEHGGLWNPSHAFSPIPSFLLRCYVSVFPSLSSNYFPVDPAQTPEIGRPRGACCQHSFWWLSF